MSDGGSCIVAAADSPMLLSAAAITKSFAGVRALKACRSTCGRRSPRARRRERRRQVDAHQDHDGRRAAGLRRRSTVAGRAVAAHDPGPRRDRSASPPSTSSRRSFPDLTVAENIALALESRRRVAARRLAARAGAAPPSCSGASARRSIPIGWSRRSACPSSRSSRSPRRSAPTRRSSSWTSRRRALTEREVESLFRVIALLRPQGAGIIYISHRLDEVFARGRPHHRPARRRDGRRRATPRDVDRARAHLDDGRPRAGGGVSEAGDPARRRRARAARRVEPRRRHRATCRCRCAGAKSSASPGSSDRAARSWPRRCSA